jgi:hypothetical protein
MTILKIGTKVRKVFSANPREKINLRLMRSQSNSKNLRKIHLNLVNSIKKNSNTNKKILHIANRKIIKKLKVSMKQSNRIKRLRLLVLMVKGKTNNI